MAIQYTDPKTGCFKVKVANKVSRFTSKQPILSREDLFLATFFYFKLKLTLCFVVTLVKIPHKILTGCYKIWWGMFQNLAKSCNLRNPIKILIRSCQDVTRCNKVFQIPVRSCMILLRSRQDSCQDLAGNFY